MDLKKIQSNAGGQTPSTGQELVDAFNENFELVDKNKADKDLTNVTEGAISLKAGIYELEGSVHPFRAL
ncbi:MAG: hypothetical protein KH586_08940, partial [Tannerella sp.]|nr:hypothetical protein [Tannerella sp.]